MEITPKYGFVALLDVLGARTASLEEAQKYLTHVRDIEIGIQNTLKGTLMDDGIDPGIFDKLSIRFFGDTILITYEIVDRTKEQEYFSRISFVLRLFLCRALELGLFFRGSLSIGIYVDKETIVLGPAVSDAANWYEQLDMMGVILTPYATLCLKQLSLRSEMGDLVWWVWSGDAVLEKPPLKHSGTFAAELFVLNWVTGIVPPKEAVGTVEAKWFYKTTRQFSIPSGTESKFANTEAFFLRQYAKLLSKREAKKASSEGKPVVTAESEK